MSYLSHLAARALGLRNAAVRPVLARYFRPEWPARTQIGAKEPGRPPRAQPSTLRQDGALPLPAPAAAAAAGAATGPVATTHETTGRAPRDPKPAVIEPAPAGRAPDPAGNPAPVLPPGFEPAPVVPESRSDADGRDHGPLATALRGVYVTHAAPARPPLPAQPAAEPPVVHIRIGRVELRGVPASLGPPPSVASESGRRASERRSSTSLEEYLAGSRGGGS